MWAASPSPVPAPVPYPVITPDGQVKDEGGRFTVKFPGAVKEMPAPANAKDARGWMHEAGDTVYMLTMFEVPAPPPLLPGMESKVDPQQMFDAFRDRSLKSMGARVVEEKPLDVSGHPGRQVKYGIAGKAKGVIRNIWVRDRLYSLQVALEYKAKPTPAAKQFLESFTVQPLWYRLETTGKRASLRFPDRPQEKTETAEVHRNELSEHRYVLELEGGHAAYCFNYVDMTSEPDASGTTIVDRLRDSMLQMFSAKQTREVPLVLKNYPGKFVEAQLADGSTLRARIYFAEMCAYMVYVLSVPGRAPDPLDEEYLNSLELSDHP